MDILIMSHPWWLVISLSVILLGVIALIRYSDKRSITSEKRKTAAIIVLLNKVREQARKRRFHPTDQFTEFVENLLKESRVPKTLPEKEIIEFIGGEHIYTNYQRSGGIILSKDGLGIQKIIEKTVHKYKYHG